ncbi:MAG: hypothetical protein ACHQ0Y_04995 [Thermodesulfovibrionales bacterium]
MLNESTSFANELSAGLAGVTVPDYVKAEEEVISNKEKLAEKVRTLSVKSFKDYLEGKRLKGLLSSSYCYTFNSKKAEHKEIAELGGELGKKLHSFCLKQRAKKDARKLMRYVLCGSYYTTEDIIKIIKVLSDNALILRHPVEGLMVIGLHLAVGDNVFGMGRDGRQHRLYVKTCLLQAFRLPKRFLPAIAEMNLDVPDLDPELYDITEVAPDAKYCVKISLSFDDREYILRNFTEVRR